MSQNADGADAVVVRDKWWSDRDGKQAAHIRTYYDPLVKKSDFL